MRTVIARNSANEGRNQSRLPELSVEWIEKIRGSADFLGLNHYTSHVVESLPETGYKDPSYDNDLRIELKTKPEWKASNLVWLFAAPEGMGDLLR